jgi:pimeloyl-ACP methyl ester carboxylesterase
VLTPTLTGLGERSHLLRPGITLDLFIEEVVDTIETEELRDVYLVGHSFGGRTVAGVADRIPGRIRRLVFLDAGLAQNGESVLDTIPPAQREQRIRAAFDLDGVKAIPVPEPQVLGVTAPEDVAWLERQLKPQPFSSYESPLRLAHPLGNNLPCSYIRCTEPLFAAVTPSASYAKSRADWQYLELKTGHDAMVISPGPLADMLIGLA